METLTGIELFAEELPAGALEIEALPSAAQLCTWSGFSTFGTLSCPESTASTWSTASSSCGH